MFLIDNNLSPKLGKHVVRELPGCLHVFDVNLHHADDKEVYQYAKSSGLHIMTKDSDFLSLVNYLGFPPKVVRLNCGNKSTDYIASLVLQNAYAIHAFLENEQSGILVIQ
jgi:predicted nuclease of predicted toxin-antitoxin system